MQDLFEIGFKYASTILALIVFLFTAIMFIIGRIKQKRKKVTAEDKAEELQEELSDEQARFKLLNELLPIAIAKAEATPLVSGPTKKLLAMSELLLSCSANGIDFERFKDFISEQLENLIHFTKVINPRAKDEVKEKAE